ncbi:hypothetical protein NEOLEDRAFT_758692 [Neolentinus lepideus HHB14362 ss-1]|uniref:Uncharacterized protein n=1 Tax=Neolentinus lepideus HHB14362 ss-1 TaxID=1314782 RepID=A0A165PSC4_9AGAM|nr:hypothetical protein NEOLEDRAFT_758692 [Neolentinus lepideus HHB14362 ss-1]
MQPNIAYDAYDTPWPDTPDDDNDEGGGGDNDDDNSGSDDDIAHDRLFRIGRLRPAYPLRYRTSYETRYPESSLNFPSESDSLFTAGMSTYPEDYPEETVYQTRYRTADTPFEPDPLYTAAMSRYSSRHRDAPTPLQSATSAFQGMRSYETEFGRRYYRRRSRGRSESPLTALGGEDLELDGILDRETNSAFPFMLKIYRGRKSTSLVIQEDWEDERLFTEFSRCYDELRSWRKYFSLRTFSTLILIWTDPADIAARYGKAPPEKEFAKYKRLPHIRVRHYLQYPEEARGSVQFVQWITLDEKHGVLFEERWSPYRIAPVALIPIITSLMVAILRVHLNVVSDEALTTANVCITAYFTCLAAVTLLNWMQYI